MTNNAPSILMVGCGKMGTAIVEGWLASGIKASSIRVIKKNPNEPITIGNESIQCIDSVASLDITPDIIMFATKPQIMPDILADYKELAQNALSISVAAGKTLAFFENYLGTDAAIVRAMPNLPATIQQGVTVATANKRTSSIQKELTEKLLAVTGTFLWADDEKSMDAVTALSGSGPAYLFLFAEYLIEAGIEIGLSRQLAEKLALATLKGSSALAFDSKLPVVELKKNVMSPGGTTEAGINTMEEQGVMKHLIQKSLFSAKKRSCELSE